MEAVWENEPIRKELLMGFETKPGSPPVEMRFTRRPLGLDFDAGAAPIIINRLQPRGHAEAVGVQIGMVVRSIDGEDVTGRDFEYQYAKLRRCCAELSYG
eukprot:gnl/TRDRNA2_/TRDRNA2_169418_c1_seq1.p1 gnl/TRDRNA2_/TRDRNA2_169418_c1~~gnl/TRDRNA2_/TRDRNA2_169418_c1_seq1.p1  ORF type:complete len:100 (+),score=16.64 gnl/TRDRNA2_/TRDRNA2_169418_c1_seq1:1-300(+)